MWLWKSPASHSWPGDGGQRAAGRAIRLRRQRRRIRRSGRARGSRYVHGHVDAAWSDAVEAQNHLPRAGDRSGKVARCRPVPRHDDVRPFRSRPPTELVRPDQAEVESGLGAVVVDRHLQGLRVARHLDSEVLVHALGAIVTRVVACHRSHSSAPDSRSLHGSAPFHVRAAAVRPDDVGTLWNAARGRKRGAELTPGRAPRLPTAASRPRSVR